MSSSPTDSLSTPLPSSFKPGWTCDGNVTHIASKVKERNDGESRISFFRNEYYYFVDSSKLIGNPKNSMFSLFYLGLEIKLKDLCK